MRGNGGAAIFVSIAEMYKLLVADEQVSDVHISIL